MTLKINMQNNFLKIVCDIEGSIYKALYTGVFELIKAFCLTVFFAYRTTRQQKYYILLGLRYVVILSYPFSKSIRERVYLHTLKYRNISVCK